MEVLHYLEVFDMGLIDGGRGTPSPTLLKSREFRGIYLWAYITTATLRYAERCGQPYGTLHRLTLEPRY